MTIAPVLVIGAGPVGLTLANELARRNAPVRIVDKADSIREVSKALILHVRTQEALLRLGVLPEVQREARPLREVSVFAYGAKIGSWDLDGILGPSPYPLILGQNRTQHILAEKLKSRGVTIEWGVEAARFEVGADGVKAGLRSVRGEEDMEASFVVGCEGSNSLLRQTLNLTFEGERYAGEQFIQADCSLRWPLPTGRSYLFLTSDGYMMVIEMPGNVVRIFISLPDSDAAGAAEAKAQLGAVEATNDEPTLEEIAHHFHRLSGLPCDLADPLWLARYRTSHRSANKFRESRAFIAGDAAHVHVPIGGQGMNTGIQDAVNLGWKLAGLLDGSLSSSVLDSYDAERRPVAEGLIKGTDIAYRGVLHPSEWRQRATRWIGPYLMRSHRVQRFMRETLEELRIAYPHSPLNIDFGGSNGPRPGERAPDPVLVNSDDGGSVRITDLDPGDRFQMLLFSGVTDKKKASEAFARESQAALAYASPRLSVHAIGVQAELFGKSGYLLDLLGDAHRCWGVRAPAAFVIRPDGVVVARAPLASWRKMHEAVSVWAPGLKGGR